MGDTKNLQTELSKLNDMVDALGLKIHSLTSHLELICQEICALNKTEDSYELCSVKLISDYLEMLEATDIQKLHDRVFELKESV